MISQQSGPRDWSPPPSNDYYDDRSYCPGESPRRSASRVAYPRSWRDRLAPWVSLVLGVAAAVFALAPQLDNADERGRYVFSLVGIVAIAYGWHALRLKYEGRSRSVVAPYFGITLGLVGTVLMLGGLVTFSLDASARGESVALQPLGVPEQEPATMSAEEQAERDSFLQSMQVIAGTLDSYAARQGTWPPSLAVTTDGTTVLLPTGELLGSLPPGSRLDYAPSADLRAYTISISGGEHGVSAEYASDSGVITVGSAGTVAP
ncbi:hypothetical protein [Planctomonas deserti]|uniref:hypothetical protein n=1 Tax=Planctomonas deserti TaxID=2144185 RepID=UPI000D3D857E|nr:hypothetical protein [Planctomonas deserti]